MAFTWRYETADGTALAPQDPTGTGALPQPSFPSQADAESWIGETWAELLAAGVDQVSLLEDDSVRYRAMSLRPAD